MNFNYDQFSNPPAPVVPVRLLTLDNQKQISITALLDSGADMTAIPSQVVERLQLLSTGDTIVEDFQSKERRVPTYTLRIALGERTWIDQVIGWDKNYVVIGRYALNQWRITLDGPRGVTTIE